jgi:hypothetical protein
VGFLLTRDFSKIRTQPLSTIPVDKFVDCRWADRVYRQQSARKSAATKISAVLSGGETEAYESESGSVGKSRAPL